MRFGSSAALTAIPIQPKLVMDNHPVEVAERMRADTFSFPKSLMCPCGQEILSLEHSLGCRKLRGVFIRHDCRGDSNGPLPFCWLNRKKRMAGRRRHAEENGFCYLQ